MPTVPGLELDLAPPLPPVAIGHGTYDDVIGVEWGRVARDVLTEAGADVLYRESPMGHSVDPSYLAELRSVATAVMHFQLREYTIEDGRLDDFVQIWRELILPLRVSLGFSVFGPWVERDASRFVWLVGFDGDIRAANDRVLRVTRAGCDGSGPGAAHRRDPSSLARGALTQPAALDLAVPNTLRLTPSDGEMGHADACSPACRRCTVPLQAPFQRLLAVDRSSLRHNGV